MSFCLSDLFESMLFEKSVFVRIFRINAFWNLRKPVWECCSDQCFPKKNRSFQRSYDVCVIKPAGGNFTRIKAFWEICEPCGNAVHVCLSSCFGNSMLISGMMNTRKKTTIFRNQCFSGEFRSCQRSCNYWCWVVLEFNSCMMNTWKASISDQGFLNIRLSSCFGIKFWYDEHSKNHNFQESMLF